MKRKTFDNYDYEEAFPVELDRDIQKKARKNFEKEHPLQVKDKQEQWNKQQENYKECEMETKMNKKKEERKEGGREGRREGGREGRREGGRKGGRCQLLQLQIGRAHV